MRRRSKGLKIFLIVLVVLLLLAGGLFYGYKRIMKDYKIVNVFVEGNLHYTKEEIQDIVMSGKYGDNSLYLSRKYKEKEISDVPFIETINVQIIDKNSVKISVYEKALAGFIEYLGRYIYFDKDGVVVEASNIRTKGIPEVVGIDFDYVILHEKLPAKDENLFMRVLNITKLCEKYKVDVEKMYFSKFGEITLYKGQVAIKLGKDKDIDIKIMNLPPILLHLKEEKGILRMEDYNEDTKRVSFEKTE